MRRSTIVVAAIAAASFSLLAAQNAHAAACTGGSTGNTSGVSFTIGSTVYSPFACSDAGIANGNNSTAKETHNINVALGTSFSFLARPDNNPGSLNDIGFTVSDTGGTSGRWTVTWTDLYPGTSLDLPIELDFAIGLTGGNNGTAYEFANVLLPNGPFSGTGTFDITFLNGGGNPPNISELILVGGNAVHADPVPEPRGIALLGIGLLGLGMARHIRRTSSTI